MRLPNLFPFQTFLLYYMHSSLSTWLVFAVTWLTPLITWHCPGVYDSVGGQSQDEGPVLRPLHQAQRHQVLSRLWWQEMSPSSQLPRTNGERSGEEGGLCQQTTLRKIRSEVRQYSILPNLIQSLFFNCCCVKPPPLLFLGTRWRALILGPHTLALPVRHANSSSGASNFSKTLHMEKQRYSSGHHKRWLSWREWDWTNCRKWYSSFRKWVNYITYMYVGRLFTYKPSWS